MKIDHSLHTTPLQHCLLIVPSPKRQALCVSCCLVWLPSTERTEQNDHDHRNSNMRDRHAILSLSGASSSMRRLTSTMDFLLPRETSTRRHHTSITDTHSHTPTVCMPTIHFTRAEAVPSTVHRNQFLWPPQTEPRTPKTPSNYHQVESLKYHNAILDSR